jgi:hypothetical protein
VIERFAVVPEAWVSTGKGLGELVDELAVGVDAFCWELSGHPFGSDDLGRALFEGDADAYGFVQRRDDLLTDLAAAVNLVAGMGARLVGAGGRYVETDGTIVDELGVQRRPSFPPQFPVSLREYRLPAPAGRLPSTVPAPGFVRQAMWILEAVGLGCPWPDGDIGGVRALRDATVTMGRVLDQVAEGIAGQARRVTESGFGDATQAFGSAAAVVHGPGGLLEDLKRRCEQLAAYCQSGADAIAKARWHFLASAMFVLALTYAASVFGPLLEAAVAPLIRLEGVALRIVLRMIRDAAMGAAYSGGLDGIDQLFRWNGFHLGEMLQALWQGTAAGGLIGSAHAGLPALLRRGPALTGLADVMEASTWKGGVSRFAVNGTVGTAGMATAGAVSGNGWDLKHAAETGFGMAFLGTAGEAATAGWRSLRFRSSNAGQARKLHGLFEEAFGPRVTGDITRLAGADHVPRMNDLVRLLVEENGSHEYRMPEPAKLRDWTRNALGLPQRSPITAYDVDSLSRTVAHYRSGTANTRPPGAAELQRFAETAAPGAMRGGAIREFGRLLRLHEVWRPEEEFDYIRNMHRTVQVGQLVRSVTGIARDAEITEHHIDGVLTTLFGRQETVVADSNASPVDPRRTDLSILLGALDGLDPRERRQVTVSLDDLHQVIRKYWDVPAGELPTPGDAKALARLWSTNPEKALDPKQAMGDIARDLLEREDPPTADQTRAAGHTLSLAIDVVGEDWPAVKKYFRPMRDVADLVRADRGEDLSPALVRAYARDLLGEHGVASASNEGRALMDAALVSDFYGLKLEARNPLEYKFMLAEVARLHELIKLEWPEESSLSRTTSFRVFEPVSEKLTGSPDPYELLKLYRQVRADSAHGLVTSIRELAKNPLAYKDAFSKWSEFDPVEYTRRNYVGERLPAHWRLPIGVEPGRWVPGHFKFRIFDEDVRFFNAMFRVFREMGIIPGQFRSVIDVASGANLAPSAAMVGFLHPEGRITRLVYEGNPHEIAYNKVMYDFDGDGVYRGADRYGIPEEIDTRRIWRPWAPVFKSAGAEYFPDHVERFEDVDIHALGRSDVVVGNVFDIPEDLRADVGVEFYGGDSFSPKLADMFAFRSAVIDAVRPGGVVVFGNVLNLPQVKGGEAGQGYAAGEGTIFPNTAYYREKFEEFLNDHPRVESFTIVEIRGDEQFSAGEEGIGLIVIKLR